MKTWTVTFPLQGTAIIEVEAETEGDALNLAAESITLSDIDWDIDSLRGSAECHEE